MSRNIDDDWEFRREVCAWFQANRINPDMVSMKQRPTYGDGHVAYQRFVLNANGCHQIDPRDGQALTELITVPVAIPPPDIAEWLTPDAPAAER